jgi:hypothetical protein
VASKAYVSLMDGKNKLLITGITNNIKTRSYPSNDHPNHAPKVTIFCCFVKDMIPTVNSNLY